MIKRKIKQKNAVYLLRPVKCPRPYTGTLFPHRRMGEGRDYRKVERGRL
jgi:hypothetical protein